MITLHVFTEEPSAKNVFEAILPRILPDNVQFRIYPHQGKQDLEKALSKTIPQISKLPGAKILITRDQDDSDCLDLKKKIDNILKGNCECEYFIRIVCRELESWFLGDLNAVSMAYPRLKPEHYQTKANFKNVDKITSPNQLLLKIIPEYKNRNTLPKLEASERIAPYLDLEINNSTSFIHTLEAIKKLTQINQ
ncbi:DUF4276 family protein [Runella slithyformis]|uniref:DUF4276 family protein n=1 Tax=Runella slithyformis (strain ATCC 29530 / DSM 19594 / LMG 11500 / NCIMB 11436 / LSU 4) TaxID=761193 RepID=A0A7U4E7M1_RUNSL|nr:DUF4276 family protein [Runella slithyformis]AEI50529.1 hypothetical protein Runsl_4185 [Runella slithyformis DSM 19594]